MAELVVTGGRLQCTFGAAPGVLKVTSQTVCTVDGKPAATIQDCQTSVNISTFGMCSSMANPQVSAATAAALGTLMPQPCRLATAGVWSITAPDLMADGKPVLMSDASINCMTGGGLISILEAGQITVTV